uniref:Uncharacterized protein n=1 Tax=Rhizophora mucronata TaxID=61149 RepID=A0A2P2LI43_RHIMU
MLKKPSNSRKLSCWVVRPRNGSHNKLLHTPPSRFSIKPLITHDVTRGRANHTFGGHGTPKPLKFQIFSQKYCIGFFQLFNTFNKNMHMINPLKSQEEYQLYASILTKH